MSVNVSIITEKRFDKFEILYENIVNHGLSIMVLANQDKYCAFCSMRTATRYITVSTEDYGYEVRITSMASRDDYNLFRYSIDIIMKQYGAKALLEGDEDSPIDNAIDFFNDEWIIEQMHSDVSVITALIYHDVDMKTGKPKPEGNEIVIDGPFRRFAFGKRLFDEIGIKEIDNDQKLIDQLYDRMLYVQWGLPDNLRETQGGTMDIDGSGIQENFKTITMYFYGERDFISDAEYVVIQKENFCQGGNKLIVVKYDDLLTIIPKTWERVDNKQLLVHETSKTEFSDFWQKALAIAAISI